MSTEVYITSDTERRLWGLIRAVDTEIGGWGYAYQESDGSFTWNEVFLVPQIATGSEVDFEATDGDVVAIEKALADGVLDEPTFCWVSWHSHHTMKPFWSGTDDKRIAALSKAGVKKLLSFVGCHDQSYQMRLDVYDVEAHGINNGQVTISDVKLVADVDDEIMREVKANLRKPPKPAAMQKSFATSKVKPVSSTMDVSTALVVRDLMDEGLTYTEAMKLIEDEGLDAVEVLLTTNTLGAQWELEDGVSLAELVAADD